MHTDLKLLIDIIEIFLLAIVVILIFHRIKIPAIIGLLLTGVIAGPHGLGMVSAVYEVELLAEIGVVLLLFAIGIEFSFSKLMRIKRYVLLGGTLQVVLTILTAALITRLFGKDWNQAVFIGFLVALSSTAIVLKLLQERAEINAPHGQTSLAILIYQDLIIVPMLLLTPLLAGKGGSLWTELGVMSLKVIAVIALTVILALWIIDRILFLVVRTRSRELFLMTILGICLAIAWLTSSIGLSLAMGAFIAGLVISESEYSHHAFASVLPFRDIFTSFFFVSMGMLLDVSFMWQNLLPVIAIILALFTLKSMLAGFVATVLGLSLKAAILTGFTLGQIGEFSFILARVGLQESLIDQNLYQLFLAAAVISMAATPLIITVAPYIADVIFQLPLPKRIRLGSKELTQAEPDNPLENHLIIIGFGLNGRNVARAAKNADIHYVILEMNPNTVRRERLNGEPIRYGDATIDESLHHVHIDAAKVVVIAIPDAAATERIVESTRRINHRLHIIVRTRFIHEVEQLYSLGADAVIPEEFETSVEIFTQVLNRFGVPSNEIEQFTSEIRSDCYRVFRDSMEGGEALE